MSRRDTSVLFIQAHGRSDLFTGVAPESLFGWRRNVGLLIALLNRKGITWKDKYATHLSEVNEKADLFFLRDWRYSLEEVQSLRRRNPNTPVVAMVFQAPRYYANCQRAGEEKALFGISQPEAIEPLQQPEAGLFAADCVIVRSKLNADLFAQLGYPREKMVLLPHAPIWTLRGNEISPASLPYPDSSLSNQRADGFDVLFIGKGLLRKGLFRLYEAFASLNISNRRLHIYSHALYEYVQDTTGDPPDYMRDCIERIVHDPAVHIHTPYCDMKGLVAAHTGIDLLICPSLIDCGPNVLVEGHQLGTPTLASTMCGAVTDLPQWDVHLVTAPEWWHCAEEADAFTERLLAEITRFYNQHHPQRQLAKPNMAPQLEMVVQIWERLLSEYFP